MTSPSTILRRAADILSEPSEPHGVSRGRWVVVVGGAMGVRFSSLSRARRYARRNYTFLSRVIRRWRSCDWAPAKSRWEAAAVAPILYSSMYLFRPPADGGEGGV